MHSGLLSKLLLTPFLALLLSLAAVRPCPAGQHIVMAFGPGYPPFYSGGDYADPSGLHGMLPDFLAAFSSVHPEYEIEPVVLPRARMNLWLETGQAQALALNSPCFLPPEHREDYLYSPSLWTTGDHLVVNARTRSLFPNRKSLAGCRVGLPLGYGDHDLEQDMENSGMQTVRGPNATSLLRMLQAGRVDAAVVNRHVLPVTVDSLGLSMRDFTRLDPPLHEFDLVTVIRPEALQFYQDLTEFVRQSQEDGLLKNLEARWTTCPDPAQD